MKKKGKKEKKKLPNPTRSVFLITASFLPGPRDPLSIPIKMLFFPFAPSADRVSEQAGCAPTFRHQWLTRIKGPAPSLRRGAAQPGQDPPRYIPPCAAINVGESNPR